jgi:hypothetical protein
MTTATGTRRQRLSMERAAAELASAIRQGDPASLDRSQLELARLERKRRVGRTGPSSVRRRCR